MKILKIISLSVLMFSVSSTANTWVYVEKSDMMTDENTSVIATESSTDAVIIVACHEKKESGFELIFWFKGTGNNANELFVRLDKNDKVMIKPITVPNNTSLFLPQSLVKNLINDMKKSSSIAISTTDLQGVSIQERFSLADFTEQFNKLKCGS